MPDAKHPKVHKQVRTLRTLYPAPPSRQRRARVRDAFCERFADSGLPRRRDEQSPRPAAGAHLVPPRARAPLATCARPFQAFGAHSALALYHTSHHRPSPFANWLTYRRVLRSAVLQERGGYVRLRQRLVLLLMVPRHLPVPRRGMRESSSPYTAGRLGQAVAAPGALTRASARWAAQTPLAAISIVAQFTLGFPSWIIWLACYEGKEEEASKKKKKAKDSGAPSPEFLVRGIFGWFSSLRRRSTMAGSRTELAHRPSADT